MLVFIVVIGGLAALILAAGWGRQFEALANFATRWMARALLVLLLIAVGLAVYQTYKSPSSASEPTPAPADAPTPVRQLIDVQVEVQVSGGSTPVVSGTTNLPDGTQLVVAMDRPRAVNAEQRLTAGLAACDPECGQWSARTVVQAGRFQAGPFATDTHLEDGRTGISNVATKVYVFLVDQTPAVEAVLGSRGEGMTGPLIRDEPMPGGGVFHMMCFAAVVDVFADQPDTVEPRKTDCN